MEYTDKKHNSKTRSCTYLQNERQIKKAETTSDTKSKILKEALRLFAANGYEAVSVEQIANAIGIKAPSLYKHYKGKRDIFNKIVEQMNNYDTENALNAEMPSAPISENESLYKNIDIKKVCEYGKAMFKYWTENEFPAHFRKMLSLERYHDAEMAQLYSLYLSAGPVGYMTDIFSSMTASCNEAKELAIAFYGPMYLFYDIYDTAEDKKHITSLVEEYIDSFIMRIESKISH